MRQAVFYRFKDLLTVKGECNCLILKEYRLGRIAFLSPGKAAAGILTALSFSENKIKKEVSFKS